MLASISVDALPDIGNVEELPATGSNFRGGFIVKILKDALGAIPLSTSPEVDGYVIAFGATCPHMGCLIKRVRHRLPNGDDPEPLVTRPCPCHGSTFDLTRGGLVILGPATQNLPQLKLQLSQDSLQVHAVDWLADPDPNSEIWPCDPPSPGVA